MKVTLDFNKFKEKFKMCYTLYRNSNVILDYELYNKWVNEMIQSIETLYLWGLITDEEFNPYKELFKEYGYYGG